MNTSTGATSDIKIIVSGIWKKYYNETLFATFSVYNQSEKNQGKLRQLFLRSLVAEHPKELQAELWSAIGKSSKKKSTVLRKKSAPDPFMESLKLELKNLGGGSLAKGIFKYIHQELGPPLPQEILKLSVY